MDRRSRLIHLNGPPGIGKSTLARRYVSDHPGTLNCDIDVLRTLIGGWADHFAAAGSLVRPAALAMVAAYLGQGRDVVLPQLLADPGELSRFEAAAEAAGAPTSSRCSSPLRSTTPWTASTVAVATSPTSRGTTRCAPSWPLRVDGVL
jgi:predicted kinase